jgi:hypothetical protein
MSNTAWSTIALAARAGSGDLIVGLLIGAGIGFFAGPLLRHWLAWREWADASREADLTDELLRRLEETKETQDEPGTDTQSPEV